MDRFEFKINEEIREQDIKYTDNPHLNTEVLSKTIIKKSKKWKQRDLEDQIREEKQNQKVMSVQNPNAIKISEVKELLKRGYSRYEKDNTGVGSIQKHYNLNWSQTKSLFNHDKLKGLRRHKPKNIEVVDDQSEQQQENPLDGILQ